MTIPLTLDSKLPRTHAMPLHRDTGFPWPERFMELQSAAYRWRYGDDDDEREKGEAEYARLSEGLKYADEPHWVEYTIMLGRNTLPDGNGGQYHDFVDPGPGNRPRGCHPDTYAALSDEQKARYGPIHDADLDRAEWESKMAFFK